jgi:hypothetical protein
MTNSIDNKGLDRAQILFDEWNRLEYKWLAMVYGNIYTKKKAEEIRNSEKSIKLKRSRESFWQPSTGPSQEKLDRLEKILVIAREAANQGGYRDEAWQALYDKIDYEQQSH